MSWLLTLQVGEIGVDACRRWINNQDELFKKWEAGSAAERKRMTKDWIKAEFDTYQDSHTMVDPADKTIYYE